MSDDRKTRTQLWNEARQAVGAACRVPGGDGEHWPDSNAACILSLLKNRLPSIGKASDAVQSYQSRLLYLHRQIEVLYHFSVACDLLSRGDNVGRE